MKGINFSIVSVIFFAAIWSGSAQQLEVTDIGVLQQKQLSEPRNTMVFLYTDWCRYCAAMKKTTFKDPDVISSLNEDFYYVPFNGETREEIQFLGKTFTYKASGIKTGYHELAAELGTVDGELAYPTIVILNPDYEIIFQQNSFINAKDMITLLTALSER